METTTMKRNTPLRIAAFVALTAFGLPLAAVEHGPSTRRGRARRKSRRPSEARNIPLMWARPTRTGFFGALPTSTPPSPPTLG